MITLVQSTSREAAQRLPALFSGQFSWKYAVYSQEKILRVRPMNTLELYCDSKGNRGSALEKYYRKNIAGNESYNLMALDSTDPWFETDFFEDYGWKHQTILIAEDSIQQFDTDFRHDFVLVPLNDHKIVFPNLLSRFPQFSKHEESKPKFFQ